MRSVQQLVSPNLDEEVGCELHYGQHIASELSEYIDNHVRPPMPVVPLFREWYSWCRLMRQQQLMDPAMKACSRCHDVKPLSSFYKGGYRGLGTHCWCKACHSAHFKLWRAIKRVAK